MKIKNAMIKGTLILTVAGLLSRIIGFYNRIFLSNLIGAKEMGIYQLIFPVYMVSYSLCCQGLQTALSKLVSEEAAKHNYSNVKRLVRLSTSIALTLACTIAVLLYTFSDFISINFLNQPECSPYLKIAAFAIPFVAIKSCIVGCYYGLKESGVPASAQLFEQLVRVGSIYFLSINLAAGQNNTATIAVIGMLCGEFLSCIYTMLALKITNHRLNKLPKNRPTRKRILGKQLISLSIPLTANRLTLTLLQSVESILIPTMLALYYHNNDLSLEIYGVLTGMAIPFVYFPSTVTNSLSVMLLPTISSAWAVGNHSVIRKAASKSMQYCLLVGILSTFLFVIYGRPLGTLVFHNKNAGEFILMLACLCPFIYITTALNSILNGLGKTKETFFHNLVSLLILILFILLAIPSLGIKGYMYGLLVSDLLLSYLNIREILKCTKLDFNASDTLLTPIITASISGAISFFIYRYLNTLPQIHNLIALFASCIIMCVIYIISLYSLKILSLDN